MSMKSSEAEHYARDWIAAWNSHDAARVIDHFAQDIEYHSPLLPLVTGRGDHCVQSRDRVDAYVRALLVKYTGQIRFRLRHVFLGANVLTIEYHGLSDRLWVDTVLLDDGGKITRLYSASRARELGC